MQLTRWLGLCAIVVGTGVVLGESILGWEGFVALTGGNTDLRIMGGAVALVGVLTLIIGDLDDKGPPPQKGSSSVNELQVLTFLSNSEQTLVMGLLEKHLNELVVTLGRAGIAGDLATKALRVEMKIKEMRP